MTPARPRAYQEFLESLLAKACNSVIILTPEDVAYIQKLAAHDEQVRVRLVRLFRHILGPELSPHTFTAGLLPQRREKKNVIRLEFQSAADGSGLPAEPKRIRGGL